MKISYNALNEEQNNYICPSSTVGRLFFAEPKKLGYLILSIITTLKNTKIQPDMLHKQCDFVLNGSSNPELDFDKLQSFITDKSLKICAIINGIDSSIYYTDFLQKAQTNY